MAKDVRAPLTQPSTFVVRMLLFVMLAALVGLMLYEPAVSAFRENPVLNGLILGILALGVIFAFQQVLRLFPEVRWVNGFRIADPGLAEARPPTMLAPVATMLTRRSGAAAVSPAVMSSMLESIASRLDESRETMRYLTGLLIFLGLLGTFWGLLLTINSVGTTIDALNANGESAAAFEELKAGLAGPLKGMGTAFSASLFGLAGSLILGFLDLQAGQAQSRFYNQLEEWLSGLMDTQPEQFGGAAPAQMRFALLDMQRSISDLGQKMESGGGEGAGSGRALSELAGGIERLVMQMRAEQKVVREWVDEQAQQTAEIAALLREQAGPTSSVARQIKPTLPPKRGR